MIYNFCIFDRHWECVFYAEWQSSNSIIAKADSQRSSKVAGNRQHTVRSPVVLDTSHESWMSSSLPVAHSDVYGNIQQDDEGSMSVPSPHHAADGRQQRQPRLPPMSATSAAILAATHAGIGAGHHYHYHHHHQQVVGIGGTRPRLKTVTSTHNASTEVGSSGRDASLLNANNSNSGNPSWKSFDEAVVDKSAANLSGESGGARREMLVWPTMTNKDSEPIQQHLKLVYGVVYSVRNIMNKLSGSDRQVLYQDSHIDRQRQIYANMFKIFASHCPSYIVGNSSRGGNPSGFESFTTGNYRLHYFESPSGVRFVLTTDPYTGSMQNVLSQIYTAIYVEYIIKNPLITINSRVSTPIRNDYFKAVIDSYIRSLTTFSS
ncbi:TRAPP complex subunit bet5 [Spiromyces aspiralis]|uniref:TRAPP complex subunit bet5 n=1 Tax=Spiromyces aspiralis TaxID=68401 RepID=A0ACC1HI83_9FUNG|nr:TRAPP complex subunit bet5 [Spiromyces aspiralis]